MSVAVSLWVALFLLLGNAYFVGAEFAVMSARRSQLEPMAEAGKMGAKQALNAVEHVSNMLAIAQFGVTVCSVSLGAIAEPLIAHALEGPLEKIHAPEFLVHPISFVVALTVASYFHVVFGEMIPKNLSIAMPVRAVLLLAPPLVVLSKVFKPVIAAFNGIANLALRLLNVQARDQVEAAFTADQVRAIVRESQREGLLTDDQNLLTGAIEFSALKSADVMVGQDKLVTVTYAVTPQEVDHLVSKTGFSRFGVRNDAGDIVGYLHLKDVIADEEGSDAAYTAPISAGKVRAVVSVEDTDEIEDVLRAMQRTGSHMARVDSHSRRSVGVVFLEDVLEELVGEVKESIHGIHGRR